MTTFDDREQAFEKKYAHDAEMQFRAEARRNKLLGLWAAEKMGLSGDDAESYAREVVAEDLKEIGEEDVYRKVAGDLEAKGANVAEAEIRGKMAELMATAKAALMQEDG